METFAKLFGSLLALVYHCFDRIVILGHLPLLTRPENIVLFFRDIHQVKTISKEVLRQRTDDYHRWVEAFAKKRHYYFYIRDEVLGPIALCVGSFLPFSVPYYLNGHHFIERELKRAGVQFRKDDNAFLWVADPKTLQSAADRLSAQLIRKQLDHWTWVVGPKFYQKDREAI